MTAAPAAAAPAGDAPGGPASPPARAARRPIVRWLSIASAVIALAVGAWWGVGVITDGEVGYVPGGDASSGPPSARRAPDAPSSDVLRLQVTWLLASYRLTNRRHRLSVSGSVGRPGHPPRRVLT